MAESVTLQGKAFTLKGELLKEGAQAPDCQLTTNDLKPVQLSSYKGKALLLISVPSLDTDVCSKETHRFNQEMDKFKDTLTAICISMDLPFAQKRWCGVSGVKNVITLSDYRTREFGEKFGVLIPDIGLLARAVFLIDSKGIVQKVHLVKEVTQEPNYSVILEQVNQLLATK